MELSANCSVLLFRVDESDYFERNGADIYTEAEISVSQAILGGTLRIEGIYEDQIVEVSAVVTVKTLHGNKIFDRRNDIYVFFNFR